MSSKLLPARIELYCLPVDLRKGQNGLLALIEGELKRDGTEDVLFIFSNRNRSLIKALFWDRTGYCILAKRLQSGRFRFPLGEQMIEIEETSLRFFLDGLNLFA